MTTRNPFESARICLNQIVLLGTVPGDIIKHRIDKSNMQAMAESTLRELVTIEQQLADAEKRAEQSERQAAAMREAMERIEAGDHPGTPINNDSCAMYIIKAALNSDAGKDFVPLADVEPLIHALAHMVIYDSRCADTLKAWDAKHPK